MRATETGRIVDPLYEPLDLFAEEYMDRSIIDTYFELLSTFELRKAAWQMQSGLLFEAYPGCTHTRRAHAIGCWVLGRYSLEDIKVAKSGTPEAPNCISLGEWLKENINYAPAYLCSLLLHDIGHPPFSHALEGVPSLDIKHEQIGRSLVSNKDAEDGINYHVLLKYLLSVYRVKTVPRNRSEYLQLYKDAQSKCLTVYDVLNQSGIQPELVWKILGGIKEPEDPKLFALQQLVDSAIDLDRIDHCLRDSYYSGTGYAAYKVRAFLQNLVIVPKGTTLYDEIDRRIKERLAENGEEEGPSAYIMVQEEGEDQFEHLLTARDFIYDEVLYHPKNLLLTGALCMGMRLIIRHEPCLKPLLPFLTDQIALQLFREPLFRGTTIEGYEKVIRGEILPKTFNYSLPCRFRTSASRGSRGNIPYEQRKRIVKELYEMMERCNFRNPTEPRAIIYACVKGFKTTANWWGSRYLVSQSTLLPIGYKTNGKEKYDLFKWLENRERERGNFIVIFCRDEEDYDELLSKLGRRFKEVECDTGLSHIS